MKFVGAKARMKWIVSKYFILSVDEILGCSKQALVCFSKIGSIVDAQNLRHDAISEIGEEKTQ